MYKIRYVPQKDIISIREEWKILEKGEEMTYFQTFDWYQMLIDFTPCCKVVENVYVVIYKSNNPIIIAPLWIVKKNYRYVNKKGIYFIGRKACSDYLNFIYSCFDSGALEFLLHSLKKKYGVEQCFFEHMLTTTSSYHYFVAKEKNSIVSEEKCVHVSLPKTFNDYYVSLGKNIRQNIRTAYNRLKKDKIEIKIVFDDIYADLGRCSDIWRNRHQQKYEGKVAWHICVKSYLYKILDISFPECIQHIADKRSHILSVYCNNKLEMFFCYGVDAFRNKVVFMTAGVSKEYARYSLGIVGLYEFIQYLIGKGEYGEVDFLRGGEYYKYALGGTDHFIADVKVLI